MYEEQVRCEPSRTSTIGSGGGNDGSFRWYQPISLVVQVLERNRVAHLGRMEDLGRAC